MFVLYYSICILYLFFSCFLFSYVDFIFVYVEIIFWGNIKTKSVHVIWEYHTMQLRQTRTNNRQRFRNGKKRISKIKGIAKVSRMARKLFTGSGFAAASWGHQSAGTTPTQLAIFERQALACSGLPTYGRCRLISLSVIYGINGTPQARMIRETINLWFQILRMQICLMKRIQESWLESRKCLLKHKHPYIQICGIMSNVIVLLIDAGFSHMHIISG